MCRNVGNSPEGGSLKTETISLHLSQKKEPKEKSEQNKEAVPADHSQNEEKNEWQGMTSSLKDSFPYCQVFPEDPKDDFVSLPEATFLIFLK